jgi:hypothetical protein
VAGLPPATPLAIMAAAGGLSSVSQRFARDS